MSLEDIFIDNKEEIKYQWNPIPPIRLRCNSCLYRNTAGACDYSGDCEFKNCDKDSPSLTTRRITLDQKESALKEKEERLIQREAEIRARELEILRIKKEVEDLKKWLEEKKESAILTENIAKEVVSQEDDDEG